ncbi:hypothetical protein [Pelagicoccus sp. SDUM812003]|uniref:hypothetical protein n=1 Tax=Pelagicoccus sp. SDUM812003 TaxID=3041267 RepID=UPI00280D6009|nr:hypothetical protein [Pelagicoccus sp. SDUM812003]MDQ8205748.1 hypothetical protein [Pelagicoccus sp. SDUM812003]
MQYSTTFFIVLFAYAYSVVQADSPKEQTVVGYKPEAGKRVEISVSEIFKLVDPEVPPKLIKQGEIKLTKKLKRKISAEVSFYVSLEGIPEEIEIEEINLK